MRKKTQTYLNNVLEVMNSLREYWPLTLRQVYYQLVAAGVITNNRNEYQKLSRVLSMARIEGLAPWEAIEDRSRVFMPSGGYDDAEHFKQSELDNFLEGYRRDLLQTQSSRPEIWIEKDALSHIVHEVAVQYCVPVIAAKGFSSTTFKNECRKRVLRNADRGQDTVILYFGDLDPSGWEMLPAMMRTLREDMELDMVEEERIALNPEQVDAYSLPIQFDAIKDTDSRAKKYRQQFGDLAVELDALPPHTLKDMVKQAIERTLDLSKFEIEQELEEEDLEVMDDLKEKVTQLVE